MPRTLGLCARWMVVDPEIDAMSAVAKALGDLDSDEARARVLRWAGERYAVTIPSTFRGVADDSSVSPKAPEVDLREGGDGGKVEPKFDDFVDLFDAVDPKSDVDKALTAAYWLQVISKQPSWQSFRVNNVLKDTGHGLTNVTATLRTAQGRKPALVRQMAKSGKSAQSWKTYKLTTSGVAVIRGKLGLSGAVPAVLADNGED